MSETIKPCKTCKNYGSKGKLVRLPTRTSKGNDVWACDYCDGPVIELAIKKANKA